MFRFLFLLLQIWGSNCLLEGMQNSTRVTHWCLCVTTNQWWLFFSFCRFFNLKRFQCFGQANDCGDSALCDFSILFQEKKRLAICNIARQWEIQQNRLALVESLSQDKDDEPSQINGGAAYVFPEESRYFLGKCCCLCMSCIPGYYFSPLRSHCISLSKYIQVNPEKDVLLHG